MMGMARLDSLACQAWAFLLFSGCLHQVATFSCTSSDAPCASEEVALLQSLNLNSLRQRGGDQIKQRQHERADALAGKSIYFLLVDRFARDDGNLTACGNKESENNVWCGGTFRGIMQQLDYIQGMGFDCVWITPVVEQYPGQTASGTGAMGYWAYNLYQIDPHFGTANEYKELIQALHDRQMCIVQDFVANHMGPIHSSADVRAMHPFNKPEYFHQLFRGNLTFDEYTSKESNWPPPAQAMWSQSGAQCTKGLDCSCYTCQEDTNLLGLPASFGCKGKMVYKEDSPCPGGMLSAYCSPGDYQCDGYNETITREGWFYDLGDLNQSHPFVRQEQLNWISWFVKEYNIDALRLDTAAFMSFEFLSELQDAADVPIIGEVTATNLSFHAQFQSDPPPSGRAVLDGVLNFPTYFTALAAFCQTWFPFSKGNLTFLGERMTEQVMSGLYTNLDTLGNFIDNHDGDRATFACRADKTRVTNFLVWSMLARGAPIVYYGTEEFLTWQRESFWTYGYDSSKPMYRLIQKINELRKQLNLPLETMDIVPTEDPQTLIFTRGHDKRMWVFLNNLPEGTRSVLYCGDMLPRSKDGYHWVDALQENQQGKARLGGYFIRGCFVANDNLPKVLVLRPRLKLKASRKKSRH